MTREETQQLLLSISALYPNFNPQDKSMTVDAWHWALNDYPVTAVKAALAIYVKTNNTGFAPSVSQLIGCMYMPRDNQKMTEGEAWALVKKAIQNSTYDSEAEFDMLPPAVQQAVGGAKMLREWAMTDSDEVNTVIMSNFQRSYRIAADRERFTEKVPLTVATALAQIGVKND